MNINNLQPWESLMKQVIWAQLGNIQNKRILDFGSELGLTADYLAKNNKVVAIEPSEESIESRWCENEYQQICGSTEELKKFLDKSFDIIICHNVLEYTVDSADILKEFSRLLDKNGYISIVKHNRPGRIMQMVVLLNDFDHANSLLDGNDGISSKYGEIHYYEDSDVLKWCEDITITKTMGIRTFWDLQQNQEMQKDPDWQKQMIDIERRVSEIKEYQEVASFHHLIIEKKR